MAILGTQREGHNRLRMTSSKINPDNWKEKKNEINRKWKSLYSVLHKERREYDLVQ